MSENGLAMTLKKENAERKITNDKDTWQWGLTFTGKHMQHNYYLYYIIDNLILENPNIKGIIEIGTGFGALSTVLGLWGISNNIPVLTVDHQKCHNENIFSALNIKYLQLDEFSDELKNEIAPFINLGPILFICDGGNKVKEFNFWTPLLKSGSIIAAHDWIIEIEYSNIEDIVEKYCTPYKQERWNEKNVQFATFRVN